MFARQGRCLNRHCEERSDEAIQLPLSEDGLLRFARNDGWNTGCLLPDHADGSKCFREETQQQREQQMSEAKSRAGWQPATYYPDPAI
ncbi:MAG: hypothetical protein JWL86_5675, partial [Rhizobium sp.]|nr:hypothetical protein [Rhizobium sp.]